MALIDSPVAPTAPGERVQILDVLRGFALLGILLMNIEAFVGPLVTAIGGLDPKLTGLDRIVDAAIYILVQGKFYTLFSLLFGAGFAMILMRAEARGSAGGWLYFRRTLVLLAIGLVHFLYIWSGDILTIYAMLALVLLVFFRHTPTGRLPKWALAFYLIPILLMLAFGLGGEMAQQHPAAAADFDRQMAEQAALVAELETGQRAAYGPEGSFAAANLQRRADFAWLMGALPIFFGPTVLALFLLGGWFLRSGALLDPAAHGALFRRLRLAGWLLGLPLAVLSFVLLPAMDYTRMDLVTGTAFGTMQVANLLLCLGYVATLVLAFEQPRWRARLAVLAPAGRMALTNYLLQSIICVGIFYGYGLGWFEQLPRAWQLPFVLVLYSLQVVFSHWWLARFRFGPAEWLWRSLTYLSPQPMRLVPAR